MLVLSRHVRPAYSAIIIGLPDGRTVTVDVVEMRGGDKVRLGITAPRDIAVHREEVWRKIRACGCRKGRKGPAA